MKLSIRKSTAFILALVLSASTARGAYVLTALNVPVTEGFSSYNGSGIPNSNWALAGVTAPAFNGQNNGSSTGGGFYSYGIDSSPNRALGYLGNNGTAESITAVAAFTNQTGTGAPGAWSQGIAIDNISVSAVPEPSVSLLAAFAFVAFVGNCLPGASGMILRWLLLLVPIALVLREFGAPSLLVFVTSLAAIVPLVEFMGTATERLSSRFGSAVGGLLNSSLSNAPEFIIGAVALRNGLVSVVKASLTGSILVNLLVGLGAALLIGGLKFGRSRFDKRRLKISSSMLVMCGFCFIVPAVFRIGNPDANHGLSMELSWIFLTLYVINVMVNIVGRRADSITPEGREDHVDPWIPVWRPVAALAVSAVGLALVSDALAEALGPTAKDLGLSDTFSGIVLLGGVGGLGEVFTAIRFARAGRQELVLAATVGSTIQMVLLVAPLLVFSGYLMGQPLDLYFSMFEVVSIVLAIFLTREIINDGRTTWLEGLLLLATYVILAVGFYHIPDAAMKVAWIPSPALMSAE